MGWPDRLMAIGGGLAIPRTAKEKSKKFGFNFESGWTTPYQLWILILASSNLEEEEKRRKMLQPPARLSLTNPNSPSLQNPTPPKLPHQQPQQLQPSSNFSSTISTTTTTTSSTLLSSPTSPSCAVPSPPNSHPGLQTLRALAQVLSLAHRLSRFASYLPLFPNPSATLNDPTHFLSLLHQRNHLPIQLPPNPALRSRRWTPRNPWSLIF